MKKPRTRPNGAGPGYFILDHIPTGGEVRVPFTPATMVDVGMNIPRRRSFYKNKRGILSTQRLEGNEFIVTVTKNPVADKKAAKPARLPSEVIADAAKMAAGFVGAPVMSNAAFDDIVKLLKQQVQFTAAAAHAVNDRPHWQQANEFFRLAFVAGLVMNDVDKAFSNAADARRRFVEWLEQNPENRRDERLRSVK